MCVLLVIMDWYRNDLQEYFGTFGEIKDCLVCKDQWTGKSRGFGFLSFEDPEGILHSNCIWPGKSIEILLAGFAVAEMLISKTHTIGGRTVQVKNAVPKSNNVSQAEAPRMCVHPCNCAGLLLIMKFGFNFVCLIISSVLVMLGRIEPNSLLEDCTAA